MSYSSPSPSPSSPRPDGRSGPGSAASGPGSGLSGIKPEPDDMALATRVADGDRDALAEIFRRYRRFVHAVAWKVTFDEDDALDVTQAVFLGLMRKIGAYSGRGEFRSWLAAVATREALDLLRRGNRRETAVEPDRLAKIMEERTAVGRDAPGDPREALERAQRLARVEEAMGGLSPQQRAVLTLHVSHDLRPREIGARLGIPPKQVSGQIRRSIVKLRATLLGIAPEAESQAAGPSARRKLREATSAAEGRGRVAASGALGGPGRPSMPGVRIVRGMEEGGASMSRSVAAMADVLDYVLGETTGPDRAAYERGLERDADRRALVEGFRRTLEEAREWSADLDVPGAARLEGATLEGLRELPRGRSVAERRAAPPRARRRRVDWRRLERILRWALTFALVGILLGAAWIGLHR